MKHLCLSVLIASCLFACVVEAPAPAPDCFRITNPIRSCQDDWACLLDTNPVNEGLSNNCLDVGVWSYSRDEWCCNL